jgi:hypothetical protein
MVLRMTTTALVNPCASSLLVLALATLLAACAAEAADPAASLQICEPNPEIAPRRLAQNGTYMNGTYLNQGYLNGIQVNGVPMDAARLQGVSLQAAELTGLRLERGELRSDAAEGEALVGATVPALLSDGTTLPLVITSFERRGALALYGLALRGESLCAGGDAGVFVPGTWDATGAHHPSATTVTFSCMRGVIAKCLTWGYGPWDVGPAMHQACTRMARADYCGTGFSYTKDGTAIDVADSGGKQLFASDPGFLFEAGWNEHGAVCVSRPRYEARGPSGEPILPSCFRSLPACTSFEEAKNRGALFANLSRPQNRLLCR